MRWFSFLVFAFALLAGCATRPNSYQPSPTPIYQQQAAIPQPELLPQQELATVNPEPEVIEEGQLYRPSPYRIASVPEAREPERSYAAPEPQLPPDKSYKAAPTFYAGNCRCPDDLDSAGRRCGKRSAFSGAGGANPSCGIATAYEAPAPKTYSPPSSLCGGSGYGATSCVTGLPKTTYVGGYYRKNGTYVRPHYRSRRR